MVIIQLMFNILRNNAAEAWHILNILVQLMFKIIILNIVTHAGI